MTLYVRWYDRKEDFSPDYDHEHHGNIIGANADECMAQYWAYGENHDCVKYTPREIIGVAD